MWVCVTRKRGDKGRRKEGRHKEEREGKKDEPGKDTWQYSDLCCCQRSSGSIQKICCHWSSIHWCSQWALRSWTAAQEAGKPLLSPEQLHLQKQLCFLWTSLTGADEPKTTQGSPTGWLLPLWLHREDVAELEYTIHKVQHHIHGAHSLCMASLGKGAACTGREHEVCTVSKTLPNHKKLPYLTAFMWSKEEVILLSCTKLCYPECKLLRCPWESSVPVKIYKQAIKKMWKPAALLWCSL